MLVTQKCQYGLRALFELALRYGEGPVKIASIAEAQAIPHRFLEVILSQLKQGGFVDSQRGNEGGYFLIRDPEDITVGDIVQFIQGTFTPVDCVMGKEKNKKCPLYGDCAFLPMWEQVQKAISDVYDKTTLKDLVSQQLEKNVESVPCYSI